MELKRKERVRIDKLLSEKGLSSRRLARRFLRERVVMAKGARVTDPGMQIDPAIDEVSIDGEVVKSQRHVYFVLNKPAGVVSAVVDSKGNKTVVDLIETPAKIFPVGRLDKETTGLILLTDDGELAHRLIHPKFHVPRVYELRVQGDVSEGQLQALRTGVMLVDGMTLPAKVELVAKMNDESLLELTLVEGRNRQIRRMCIALGIGLNALKRVRFGNIELGDLKEGEYREISGEEDII